LLVAIYICRDRLCHRLVGKADTSVSAQSAFRPEPWNQARVRDRSDPNRGKAKNPLFRKRRTEYTCPSYALVIASESGDIASFDLTDIRSVKLLEDGTRRDLNEFAKRDSIDPAA
jgi:hypothetical protein